MNMSLATRNNLRAWLLTLFGSFVLAGVTVTGNKIFFAPLLALGLWAWVRFATKYPAAALIIIVFFAEECFDMFSFGLRQRLLSDIGIALMLPLVVVNFRKIWNHIVVVRSSYAIAILLFFCAILISLYFGSHMEWGQPMVVGLTVARKYLLFCSYFFLVAVGATREDCYRFMKYLAWLGAVIAFLSVIEVFLGGGIIFSQYYAIGQERAGRLRIHVGTFLIVFSVIYSFVKYQYLSETSQQRFGYLLILGLDLFVLISIVMTRAIFLGLLVAFIFWMTKKITNRKIMLFCTTISVIMVIFLSGFGRTILSETFFGKIIEKTSSELNTNKGNIALRKQGAQYFLNLMLHDSPLAGIGLFSSTHYPNNPVTRAGDSYHYYIVDINAIATVVYFGLQGALLLAFFVVKSLRDSISAMNCVDIESRYNFNILFFVFIYILATPSVNNVIVERMLMYSGVFFYLLMLYENHFFVTVHQQFPDRPEKNNSVVC